MTPEMVVTLDLIIERLRVQYMVCIRQPDDAGRNGGRPENKHIAMHMMRSTCAVVWIESSRIMELACNIMIGKKGIWDGLVDH